MPPLLQTLTDSLTRAVVVTGPWAPAVLFGAAFVEHVFPPLPGDLVVVLGAWYAVHGQLSWPLLLVCATAGAVAGAWVDHRVGVFLGRRLDRAVARSRFLTPEQLASFEAAYRRWGSWLLLLNRFMPGVRAFLFVAAGTAGLPLGRVLLLGGLSAAVWNGLLLGVGSLVAKNAEDLVLLIDRYMMAAGAVMVLVATALVVRALWRGRRGGTA
jgi:membrane protein DedA with SNARE-associated domain